MNYLEIAQEQLRRDEGERLHAYLDSEGFWTIGVGHLIDARRGGRISKAASEFIFEEDTDEAASDARAVCPQFDQLSETRKAVLVNMCFQMGRQGVSEFQKMLAAITVGDFAGASRHMLDSKWAQQTTARAVRLAGQMASGDRP
jgi:lysozyme